MTLIVQQMGGSQSTHVSASEKGKASDRCAGDRNPGGEKSRARETYNLLTNAKSAGITIWSEYESLPFGSWLEGEVGV